MNINLPLQDEVREFTCNYYVGHGNDETFLKWGEQAINLALEWLKNSDHKKIHSDISLPDLSALFHDCDPPQKGAPIDQVFQECCENILNNSVRVNNPRYIGHMITAIPWFSVVVNILITAINQNQVKIETALSSSFVERQTIAWMHRLIFGFSDAYYEANIQSPSIALGNMTGGATVGNLTALSVAREHCFPGMREKGILAIMQESPYKGITILSSKRAHYSLKKSAAILGLGRNAVTEIPVDRDNRIRLDLLEEKIAELKKNNIAIMALVGIAGTTETGNIDPLMELGEIAQREKIWFHVDAAWGGALLLAQRYRNLLAGIEKADSVTLDGHKLFCLPLSHGMVLFKDPNSLNLLLHNANYILRKGSVDLGRTSLEGSRRFDALKLWFALKLIGTDGYSLYLQQAMHLTNLMKELLDNDPDFERTSTPGICILTYRFVPWEMQKELLQCKRKEDTRELDHLNLKINEINTTLQRVQREGGKSFVSRTVLESAGYGQEIVVLRAVLINLLTQPEHLKEILEEQREIGRKILDEK